VKVCEAVRSTAERCVRAMAVKTKKLDKRYVWKCSHDTWSWEDGCRCYAGARKAMTEEAAHKALSAHLSRSGHSDGYVRRLKPHERWAK
jgi:hypothetical protein